jgi:DNA-binding beta-propeller fold protein YncE
MTVRRVILGVWVAGFAGCSDAVGGTAGLGEGAATTSGDDDSTAQGAGSGGPGPAGTGSSTGEVLDPDSTGVGPIYDVGTDQPPGDCGCGSELSARYLWVANSGQSTISKIDTDTRVELGRYLTRADGHGDPSRTSVSLTGTAVAVANRNGGITKVWADASLCDPMTNGVPGVQTSSGAGDVLPWGEDDCIAWFADFDYTTQRPIAWMADEIDGRTCVPVRERLWTSGCNKFADPWIHVHRLDGADGTVLDSTEVEGLDCIDLGGYGGAVDPEGNFWVSTLAPQSKLARIDAVTLAVRVWDAPVGAYGITVDRDGRPWLSCNNGFDGCSAARFDPTDESWALATDHILSAQSGIAQDPSGRMWMNGWWYDDVYSPVVASIDPETLEVGPPIATPAGAKGIAVDAGGFVWSVAPQTNAAYRIDPATGTVETIGGLSGPYTYSDMTGSALLGTACDPAG